MNNLNLYEKQKNNNGIKVNKVLKDKSDKTFCKY